MTSDQITFIDCICFHLTQTLGIQYDSHFKLNTAEVMVVAIVAALFFGENFSETRLMLKSHGYISSMLSESRLNRKMHEIDISVWQSVFSVVAKTSDFAKQRKKFYYGLKLHMITISKGLPVEFIITPAAVADVTALKTMEISLPFGSTVSWVHSPSAKCSSKRTKTASGIIVRLFS